MTRAAQRIPEPEPVRVLGRGLHAKRGIRLTLRALREAAGKTQVEVSQATGIDQADLSRLERREDFDECQIATLRRYIEALGGNLELVGTFGNKAIKISGVFADSSGCFRDLKARETLAG